MKLKKWVALATAAAMCLSMTACSVSVSTNETTKAAEPSAETTAAEAGDKEESGEAAESAAEGDLVATADYPTKPITMIIPYAAGGTTDVWGRKLAALLEKYLGQAITVTNQGGASGSIGSQFVKEQPSDGYTVLVCAEYNTLEELLDDIKANPGKITMSHSGPGGSGHNQGLVMKELGYDVAMTSFDSGNDALLGVIGGQVDFTNPNISTLGGYIESGDVKPLAVFSDKRMEAYPDIPAFTESVPEAEKYLNIPYTLLSFVVNNDTPQDVVDVLKAASQKVFADPEWTDFVKQKAADPVYEEYTDDASIQKFYDNWKSVICWLQYDNGVAEKSPEDFGIARVAE